MEQTPFPDTYYVVAEAEQPINEAQFNKLEAETTGRLFLWPHPTLRYAAAPKMCRIASPRPEINKDQYAALAGFLTRLLIRHGFTVKGEPVLLKATTTLTSFVF
jgi:hypothetical protein